MNLKTRIRSTAIRHFSTQKYLEKLRRKARSRREKRGQAPTVHYFHQVDDPYSHLAVQKLDELKARYNLPFQPHLASMPQDAYQGSAEHFSQWAYRDACSVAADYNTVFKPTVESPSASRVAQANDELAPHEQANDFALVAFAVGQSLWSSDDQSNKGTQASHGSGAGRDAVAKGNALREQLGHYQGAMFYFDGEWFWGIDRLRLLEQRLRAEGYGNSSDGICVPEPTPTSTEGADTGDLLLEYFPSLRSPYTAVGHQRVLDLIARSGIRVEVRPVMPMLMRGIPAPRAKQQYIITDAAREARAHGVPLGRVVDPFGEPVKRAFALFPGALELGSAMPFVTAYLNAAWFEGIDITTDKGLAQVAANANIDWSDLQRAAQQADWEALLAENLSTMLAENLWGVPSFRVSGGNQNEDYACWGQDRIWRVENEIARRL